MADLRVIIRAVNQASGAITKIKNEIEGTGKAGKEADGG